MNSTPEQAELGPSRTTKLGLSAIGIVGAGVMGYVLVGLEAGLAIAAGGLAAELIYVAFVRLRTQG